MDYLKHYNLLIERSKNRVLNTYTEKHHIIPKSMGGTDDKENIAILTAREHFVAHILLVKIYHKQHNLIKAVQMMCVFNNHKDRSNNRMYGWLREEFSKSMSLSQSGSNNSQYGTMWISLIETKQSKKIKKRGIS